MIWIGLGLGIFFVLLVIDYYSVAKYSYVIYLVMILSLFLVLLFGKTVWGQKGG